MADRDDSWSASARAELAELVAIWLPEQRWFAGKGHVITEVVITDLTALRPRGSSLREGAEAAVASAVESTLGRLLNLDERPQCLQLVVGTRLDGDRWQTYQVPVAVYDQSIDESSGSAEDSGRIVVGRLPDGRTIVDALSDPLAMTALLQLPSDVPVLDPAQTHGRPPDADDDRPPSFETVRVDPAWERLPPRRLGAEQSNTSIVVGESALAKVFRPLVPGKNPDIEIHAALATNPYIARCRGWVNGGWHDPATGRWQCGHLALVQELLVPATEGWELACARVAAGRSFAAEAHALGVATAAVHADLRSAFPTEALSAPGKAKLVARLLGRLDEATRLVPDLADVAPALRRRIEAVTDLVEPVDVQRVHGDFHLGQVLLATDGWKLLDFEGEPGAPIEARTVPDHALRDVAGMLRSFAYAGAQSGSERSPGDIAAWRDECERSFLAGYVADATPSTSGGAVDGSPLGHSERIVLDAYLVDKAVYEAVYEKRYRPDWLHIPLEALTQLAG